MKLNKYINTGQTEFFGNRKLFPRCVRISVILISDALEGAKGLDPNCHLKSLDSFRCFQIRCFAKKGSDRFNKVTRDNEVVISLKQSFL